MFLLLIRHGRHGEPFAVPEEGPLNKLGLSQAELAGEELKDQGIERLFSSPYPRATQTALAISRMIGIPVEIRHRLHEKTGPTVRPARSQIKERYPQFVVPGDMPEIWWPQHEETRPDVYDRVRPLAEEFKSLGSRHERVVAVAHDEVINALVSVWVGAPPVRSQRFFHHNCGFTLLSHNGIAGRIHYLNRVSHLGALDTFDIFR